SGCGYQSVHTSGGVTEFKFGTGTYVGLVVIPLALAAIGVAMILRGRDTTLRVLGAIGLAGLLLICVMILPGVWRDRVVVDSQGVTQTTGFWWAPTVKTMRFADTKEVRLVSKPAGPDQRVQRVWEVHLKNGSTVDI